MIMRSQAIQGFMKKGNIFYRKITINGQTVSACSRQMPAPICCLINISTWEFSFDALTFFTAPLFYRKKPFVKGVDAIPLILNLPHL
jgi:hypothetical protein